MLALLLPFLQPLLGKISVGTLKWIALLIAFLAWSALCWRDGYKHEESTYNAAIAKSAEHQLYLEQQYRQIGNELGTVYINAQTASQARTKLELQALRSRNHMASAKHGGVLDARSNPDLDVVGVLRRAYAPH